MQKYSLAEIDFIREYVETFEELPVYSDFISGEERAAHSRNYYGVLEDKVRTIMFAGVSIAELKTGVKKKLAKWREEYNKEMEKAKLKDAGLTRVDYEYKSVSNNTYTSSCDLTPEDFCNAKEIIKRDLYSDIYKLIRFWRSDKPAERYQNEVNCSQTAIDIRSAERFLEEKNNA